MIWKAEPWGVRLGSSWLHFAKEFVLTSEGHMGNRDDGPSPLERHRIGSLQVTSVSYKLRSSAQTNLTAPGDDQSSQAPDGRGLDVWTSSV